MRSSAAAFAGVGERTMMPSNWWIFPLMMPLVMVVVAFLMVRMILRQRYAGGEIELEEYERRLEPLLRHEPRKKLS